MGPKVVHLSTVHRHDDVRIFHKEAATLAAAGFEVVLIACGETTTKSNGVTIRMLRKPKSRWARITRTLWQAYRAALTEGAAIYHFHDPELIAVGLLLKLHGKRVIYDVHEDVAKDLDDKAYLPRWSKPILRIGVKCFEWLASACFDRIIAATSAIERKFPKHRVTLVRNVPILDELASPRRVPFAERPRAVVYVGGLGAINGVDVMVKAIGELPASANVRLILAGRFNSPEDEQATRALSGWNRVDYFGWVGREQIARLFAQARAGLVVYQPSPNIMECEPNKFFEVLSAGLPLIASNLPHWRRFIGEHKCGFVVPPNDPHTLAAAILEMVDQPQRAEEMGAHGREIVVDGYNWNIDGERLLRLYRELLPAGTTAAK